MTTTTTMVMEAAKLAATDISDNLQPMTVTATTLMKATSKVGARSSVTIIAAKSNITCTTF